MQKFTELTFISRLGVQNLKRVSGGYMCTCPRCGSATPHKKKLYILTENKDFITVFCQKCGINTNLKTFIKDFNPNLFQDYLREEREELLSDLKCGTLFQKEQKKSEINTIIDLTYKFKLNQKYFKPAKHYKEAINFCKKRHIEEHIDKLYFNIHPNHILSGMVIFPFYLEDQETLYALQGRRPDIKKFSNFIHNESMKVYNLYNVDLNAPVYIFESIIDSLMISNTIAMLGTGLSKPILNMIKERVWILDNDRVGKNKALSYLDSGEKVLIYPDDFKFKDFNEAICSGQWQKKQLVKLIKDNTFQGLIGSTKLKFQLMRKK